MTEARPLAADLATWVAGLRPDHLPREVVADSRRRILDTIGLMLAAAELPIGRAVRTGAAALGAGNAADIVGTGERSTASLAALVNGTLAHALDFDDTHNASVMHPSSVSVPTALAIARAHGLSGADLVLGVAIGNEIGCRLGMAAPGAFHDVGLHPTSVLGAPAAAFVAGRLMKLSAAEMASAVGITGSQGSGILEAYSDGTWSKTMHPGWAAHAGVVAANLSRAGFSGPASGLDGRYGLFPTHVQARGYRFDYDIVRDELGTRWHMLDTAFKLYPCAHAIHAFVEGVLILRERHGIDASTVKKIVLDVPAGFVGQIAEPRAAKLTPRTTTHARASVFYAVAAALLDGELAMRHYEDAAISRPDILALCQRIEHVVEPMPSGPIRFSGGMTITLADGQEFSIRIDEADGTGSRPLSDARLEAKFRETSGRALDRDAAEALIVLCRTIETLPRVDKLLDTNRLLAA